LRDRTVLLGIVITLGMIVWLSETFTRGYTLFIGLFGCVAAYCVYLIASQIRFRKRPRPEAPDFRPYVSVIIPAKNEESVIAATVENVLAMEYSLEDKTPHYELLVVNDGSTDSTGAILDALAERYPGRLFIYHRQGGYHSKAAVLNEAQARTHGEIIFVLDADAKVKKDFLSSALPYLADTRVGAMQTAKHILNFEENWLTRAQEDELTTDRAIQKGRDAVDGAVELRGSGMLLKRTAIEDVGGWTESALTEDVDMSAKLCVHGWEIRFAHDVPIWEEAILSWGPLIRQRRRWAEGGLRKHIDYFYATGLPLSLNKKMDILVFFSEFALPIWMLLDILYQGLEIAAGRPFHLSVFMSVVCGLIGILVVNITGGFASEFGFKPGKILRHTGRTLIYMLHWIPVILWTTVKILVKSRPGQWKKTEHHGQQASQISLPEAAEAK
jgi:1,2-diacylglycerol 3-beta-glucosyltransferase